MGNQPIERLDNYNHTVRKKRTQWSQALSPEAVGPSTGMLLYGGGEEPGPSAGAEEAAAPTLCAAELEAGGCSTADDSELSSSL